MSLRRAASFAVALVAASAVAVPTAGAIPSADTPEAFTSDVLVTNATTATVHGSVNPEGQATTYRAGYDTFDSPWCQDGTGNPTHTTPEQILAQTDTTEHEVAVQLTGLTKGTNYCVGIMAHNGSGDNVFTDTVSFVAGAPLVDLDEIASTSGTTATITGQVNPSGQATTYNAEYDEDTSDFCQNFGQGAPAHSTAAKNLAAVDTEYHQVSVELTGLTGGHHYCARLVAVNGSTTTRSSVFPWTQGLPTAFTNDVSITGATTAAVHGSVNPTGQATTYHADFDTIDSNFCQDQSAAATHHTAPQSLNATDLADHDVSVSLTGLTAGTKYCVMIVAHNGSGDSESFGGTAEFTAGLPQADTFEVVSTGATTATVQGQVNPSGQATTYKAGYDVPGSPWCDSHGSSGPPAHTTAPQNLNGNDSEFHDVSVDITGLTAGTHYCVGIIATNGSGSATGGTADFVAGLPQAETFFPRPTGPTTATLNGEVNPAGQATTYRAQFDEQTAPFCTTNGQEAPAHTTAPQNLPDTDSAFHQVSVDLTGLVAGHAYCARLIAHNGAGDAQGHLVPFTAGLPEADTSDAFSTGATTGRVVGQVNGMGQATQIHADYDTVGSNWCSGGSQGPAPNHTADQPLGQNDATSHPVAIDISGLTTGASYCVAIVATNPAGTARSDAVAFTVGLPEAQAFVVRPTGATSAEIEGQVNPGGQATTATAQFGEANTNWCQTNGSSGPPPHETAAQNVAADSDFHEVTIAIGGLTAGTHYCMLIAATNAGGTDRSTMLTFVAGEPAADTFSGEATGATTALLHGRVNPVGQATTYRADYDVAGSPFCTSGAPASHQTAVLNLAQNDNSFHDVQVEITGLTAGQNYCAAIEATNGAGTVVSAPVPFTAGVPSATQDQPTVATPTSEHVSGTVNPHGQATTARFQWDAANSDFCQNGGFGSPPGHQEAVINVGNDSAGHAVQGTLAGLTTGDAYCVVLTATNASGTVASELRTFTAGQNPPGPPIVTAQDAGDVTATGATLHARVNPSGSLTTVTFQWDVATSPWCSSNGATGGPAHQEPVQNLPGDTSDHDLTAPLTGLAATTAYCFRAEAVNTIDLVDGAIRTFTTSAAGGGDNGGGNNGGSGGTGGTGSTGGTGGTGSTGGTGGTGQTSGAGGGTQQPAGAITAGKSRVTGGATGTFAVGSATCAAGASCSAEVTVKGAIAGLRIAIGAKRVTPKTLAHATISVAGGKRVVLNIKLSRKVLAALKKAKKVKASVTVNLTAAGHATVTKTYTITLVAPKKKKK